MLGESADLRGKLVDDVVRVGWNLSQNVSLNTKPPQSDWIAGVDKNWWKAGLVGGGHRVDTSHGLKLVECQGAAEIRLHVRESDGLAGIVEGGEHATCIIPP